MGIPIGKGISGGMQVRRHVSVYLPDQDETVDKSTFYMPKRKALSRHPRVCSNNDEDIHHVSRSAVDLPSLKYDIT